jgi:hypothetical protein
MDENEKLKNYKGKFFLENVLLNSKKDLGFR